MKALVGIFTTSSLSAFTVDIDVTIEELYLGGTLVSAVAGWACPYMTPATLETPHYNTAPPCHPLVLTRIRTFPDSTAANHPPRLTGSL